ncbi:hypothetical protein [Methylotenera sp. 1P/1]|uniref:hypothetical protein n=1 Tax=Methylotenera sp. 1P/1 TaxID=1131551 RepID=UPI00036DE57C|nr:hypothetical protein [Methylotenera sp. 1P/1]
MVESLRKFFRDFISGRLGLPITFWLYGVLIALTLDFLTSKATTLWQVVLIVTITLVHLVLIVVAVWNASKLYLGSRYWKWLARLVVIINVFKWLWHLPLLASTLSSALGFPIYSDKYWLMGIKNNTYVCERPEYFDTPERLAKRKNCGMKVDPKGELIGVRCHKGLYVYTYNKETCLKYLNRIKPRDNVSN